MSDTAILERPGTALRLHSATVLTQSRSTGWAVRTPDNRLLGIGQGLGDILRTMQEHGTLTPTEIQGRLADTWTLPEILTALTSLRRYRIILAADEEETTRNTTAVHELAHGLTLTACGVLPHRMGVMLFYLSPAAFCDVTEAWLLPRRERVAVAFAGIIVQTSIGAVALLACLLMGDNGFLAW